MDVDLVETGAEDVVVTQKVADAHPAWRSWNGPRCPVCHGPLGEHWWPHVRIPSGSDKPGQLVHLWCAVQLADEQRDSCTREENFFLLELNKLLGLSPRLWKTNEPGIRIVGEDEPLRQWGNGIWPPVPVPAFSSVAFAVEGLMEIRISCCQFLRTLPPEIGRARGMKALVLISNNLETIPAEVGQLHELEQLFLNGNFLRDLPVSVAELPVLQEICLDANWFEQVPPFSSPRLTMFTAPGNRLVEVPELPQSIERLEVHGNQIQSLNFSLRRWPGLQANWEKVCSLKLMGNQLTVLPDEIGNMKVLRIFMVSHNRLRSLPRGLVGLQNLEWVFAYDNQITALPPGLLQDCRYLARVLFEANPLTPHTLVTLFGEARRSRHVRTIGLDTEQIKKVAGVAVPNNIKVGALVGNGGPAAHFYMKLVRWEHIKQGRDAAEIDGLELANAVNRAGAAETVIVAFSASQAEPEWLGFLSRLAVQEIQSLPQPADSLQPLLDQHELCAGKPLSALKTYEERQAALAAMWSRCNSARAQEHLSTGKLAQVKGFDVLCVVDHSMHWYGAHADEFSKAVSRITTSYKHVLCVGASMGGFGALLHGGRLAQGIIAFGPQARLADACLRPQAHSMRALDALTAELQESAQMARKRGAFVQIHCPSDEHIWHALQLPLEDLSVTIHPMCPRKPFARLLDKCKNLIPIVADAMLRLQSMEAMEAPAEVIFRHLAAEGGLVANGLPKDEHDIVESSSVQAISPPVRIAIACWRRGGGFDRFAVASQDVVNLLFQEPALDMPRAGEWFCAKCHNRNIRTRFFCKWCGKESTMATMVEADRVPDGNRFPEKGDWGCGSCGEAVSRWEKECTQCWSPQTDSKNVFVS